MQSDTKNFSMYRIETLKKCFLVWRTEGMLKFTWVHAFLFFITFMVECFLKQNTVLLYKINLLLYYYIWIVSSR